MKKQLQNSEINAFKDIERFACNIAPIKMITRRYFGEEPFDSVTRQYNEQMKIYLPRYGIEAVEIPRKKIEGKIISATKVREALLSNDWNLVNEMVPISTYKYLKRKRKNIIKEY